MKKNKLSRRDFLIFTATGAGATVLASCTRGARELAGTPAATQSAIEVPTIAKDIKLVAFTKEGDVSDGLKVCVDLVKERTGVTLEVQSSPEESFVSKVVADFAAGGGAYDLIFMPYNMVHEYQALGHLLPLDNYISAAASDIQIDDFIPALLHEYGGWDGQQWALPGKADVYINAYRKDMMEDTAVQDLFKSRTGMDLKVPVTVEEQKVLCEFFTKSLNPDSPLEYGWSNWSEKLGIKWWWGPRMATLGGSWLDENNHPNFNNEAGLQALNDLLDMHKFAPPDIITFDWGKANQAFLNASTFTIDQWNSFGAECNTPEGYYGTSEVVGKTGFDVLTGYGEGKRGSVLGGWCMAIPKYTKDAQAAFEVLAAITSTEAELLRVPIAYSPTRMSTYDQIEYELAQQHYDATAQNFAVVNIGGNIYAPPIGQQLETFMDTTLSETLQGQHTAEEALEIIETEWTKMLQDADIYG